MKFKFIYTCFLLAFVSFVFLGNKNGRAASQNQGNTGAPGDQTLSTGAPRTCISCHGTSAGIQVTLDIDVTDANGNSIDNTGYTPEETYDVKVTINTVAGSPAAFGFQIVCLNAAEGDNGSDIPTWSDPADNVQIALASATGRTYAEHKGAQDNNEFMVKWTAPAAGSGEVTFYSCGNGVNLSNSTGGDNAACGTLNIQEAEGTAATNLLTDMDWKVFPNPVSEQLFIEADATLGGPYTLRLMDLTGRSVQTKQLNWDMGEQWESLDVSQLSEGMYTLQMIHAEGSSSRKLVKTR